MALDYHPLSKKYENGYCLPILPKKLTVCCRLKTSEYMFYLNEDELYQLRQAKVKLPKEVIDAAFYVVNKHRLVIPSHYYWRCCGQCFSILIALLFLFILIAIGMTGLDPFKYVLMAVIAICQIVTIGVALKSIRRIVWSYEMERTLHSELWKAVGETCIQYNAIVLVDITLHQRPILNIMRYDVTDCKMYLTALIQSREKGRTDQSTSPEDQADEKIRRAIKRLMPFTKSSLENLPDAPYNRHPVRKSKMCLCQMIETGSPLVN